jgi:putative intracellular protease/amidase
MADPKILILMSDYGHDPTETSVPYTAFKKAGFEVQFATENGKTPACDRKMLRGVTQKLLVRDHPPHRIFPVFAYQLPRAQPPE